MVNRLILASIILLGALRCEVAEARVCFIGDTACIGSGTVGALEGKCSDDYKECDIPKAGASYCGQKVGENKIRALYKDEDCCSKLNYRDCSIESENSMGYGKHCRGTNNVTYWEFCGCKNGYIDTQPDAESSRIGSVEGTIKDEQGHEIPYTSRCGQEGEGKCQLAICNGDRRWFRNNSGEHCLYRTPTRCGAFGCEQLYDCDNSKNYYRAEDLILDYVNEKTEQITKVDNFIEFSDEDPWSNEKDKSKNRYSTGTAGEDNEDRDYRYFQPTMQLPYGKKIIDYNPLTEQFIYDRYNVTNKIVCSYRGNQGRGLINHSRGEYDTTGGLDCNMIKNFCYKWEGCNKTRGWYNSDLNIGVLYGEIGHVYGDYRNPGAYEHWMNEVERNSGYIYQLSNVSISPARATGEVFDLHSGNRILRDNFFRAVNNPRAKFYAADGSSLSLCKNITDANTNVSCRIVDEQHGCTYITHACHKNNYDCYKRIGCSEENRFYHSFINAAKIAFDNSGNRITLSDTVHNSGHANNPGNGNAYNTLYESSLNGIYWMDFYQSATANGPAGLADNEIYPACIYEINACNDTENDGKYGGGCYRKSLVQGCIDNFEDIRNHELLEIDWLNWFKDWRPICNDNTRCYQASSCDFLAGSYSSSPNTSFFNTIHSTATMSTCYRGVNCNELLGVYTSTPNSSFFYVVDSQATGSICYRGQECNKRKGAYSSEPNTLFFTTIASQATGSNCYRGEQCNEEGAYTSTPNTLFFAVINSLASGSKCYRGQNCAEGKGNYTSSPNTSFFITIDSQATGSTCYRGLTCAEEIGVYTSTPNTSFFYTVDSLATGLHCYRGMMCRDLDKGAYSSSPNTVFFNIIESHASGSSCYRGIGCDENIGTYTSSPNTSFFITIKSGASGSLCYRGEGCAEGIGAYYSTPNNSFFVTIQSEATSTTCYRGEKCDEGNGAYTSSPNSSFFFVIESKASGSTCYRGMNCRDLDKGAYSSTPNTSFFNIIDSHASGSSCYRGTSCRLEAGVYTSVPNTSFFYTAASFASGSGCYRGTLCRGLDDGAYSSTPNSEFFEVIGSHASGSSCYRAKGCNFNRGAYSSTPNTSFFETSKSLATGSACYRGEKCNTNIGVYTSSPNEKFFKVIQSAATSKNCYRGEECIPQAYSSEPNTSFFYQPLKSIASGSVCYRKNDEQICQPGAYTSKPNTLFFKVIESSASGDTCYRGEKCRFSKGAYSSTPNTLFFYNPSKSVASGSECYRANDETPCNTEADSYPEEGHPEKLNTSYFYVIKSYASGYQCFRISRCHKEVGAYSSSPNTSFFDTPAQKTSDKSTCYRGTACNINAGARTEETKTDINTSYFLLVNSQASGSICYRGDRCNKKVGSYGSSPNTSFFLTSREISLPPVSKKCYRGTQCNEAAGAYVDTPNTEFFTIISSHASGSQCYRIKDCMYSDRANGGPCKSYPDTAYFLVDYNTVAGYTCTKAKGCVIYDMAVSEKAKSMFIWKDDTQDGITCKYIEKPVQGYYDVNYCIFDRIGVPGPYSLGENVATKYGNYALPIGPRVITGATNEELLEAYSPWRFTKGKYTATDEERNPQCTKRYKNSGTLTKDECGNEINTSGDGVTSYIPIGCNQANGWDGTHWDHEATMQGYGLGFDDMNAVHTIFIATSSSNRAANNTDPNSTNPADKFKSCYFEATSVTWHGFALPKNGTTIETFTVEEAPNVKCYKYTKPRWTKWDFSYGAQIYTFTDVYSNQNPDGAPNALGGGEDEMQTCNNSTKGGAYANRKGIHCGAVTALHAEYPSGCNSGFGWYEATSSSRDNTVALIGGNKINGNYFNITYTSTSSAIEGVRGPINCFSQGCYHATSSRCHADANVFDVNTITITGGPQPDSQESVTASYAKGCNTSNFYYDSIENPDETAGNTDGEGTTEEPIGNTKVFVYTSTTIKQVDNCQWPEVTCWTATECEDTDKIRHPNWCYGTTTSDGNITCDVDNGCKIPANTQYFNTQTEECDKASGGKDTCTNVAYSPKCTQGDTSIWTWANTSTTSDTQKVTAENIVASYPMGCNTSYNYYNTSETKSSQCPSRYFNFDSEQTASGCGHTVGCQKYKGCVQDLESGNPKYKCLVTQRQETCSSTGIKCNVADRCKDVPPAYFTTSSADINYLGYSCTYATGVANGCTQENTTIWTYSPGFGIACDGTGSIYTNYATNNTYWAYWAVGCNTNNHYINDEIIKQQEREGRFVRKYYDIEASEHTSGKCGSETQVVCKKFNSCVEKTAPDMCYLVNADEGFMETYVSAGVDTLITHCNYKCKGVTDEAKKYFNIGSAEYYTTPGDSLETISCELITSEKCPDKTQVADNEAFSWTSRTITHNDPDNAVKKKGRSFNYDNACPSTSKYTSWYPTGCANGYTNIEPDSNVYQYEEYKNTSCVAGEEFTCYKATGCADGWTTIKPDDAFTYITENLTGQPCYKATACANGWSTEKPNTTFFEYEDKQDSTYDHHCYRATACKLGYNTTQPDNAFKYGSAYHSTYNWCYKATACASGWSTEEPNSTFFKYGSSYHDTYRWCYKATACQNGYYITQPSYAFNYTSSTHNTYRRCYKATSCAYGYVDSVPSNEICTEEYASPDYAIYCYGGCRYKTCEDYGYVSGEPSDYKCTKVDSWLVGGLTNCYKDCVRKECSDYNSSYVSSAPDGQVCDLVDSWLVGGLTCYKDCRNKITINITVNTLVNREIYADYDDEQYIYSATMSEGSGINNARFTVTYDTGEDDDLDINVENSTLSLYDQCVPHSGKNTSVCPSTYSQRITKMKLYFGNTLVYENSTELPFYHNEVNNSGVTTLEFDYDNKHYNIIPNKVNGKDDQIATPLTITTKCEEAVVNGVEHLKYSTKCETSAVDKPSVSVTKIVDDGTSNTISCNGKYTHIGYVKKSQISANPEYAVYKHGAISYSSKQYMNGSITDDSKYKVNIVNACKLWKLEILQGVYGRPWTIEVAAQNYTLTKIENASGDSSHYYAVNDTHPNTAFGNIVESDNTPSSQTVNIINPTFTVSCDNETYEMKNYKNGNVYHVDHTVSNFNTDVCTLTLDAQGNGSSCPQGYFDYSGTLQLERMNGWNSKDDIVGNYRYTRTSKTTPCMKPECAGYSTYPNPQNTQETQVRRELSNTLTDASLALDIVEPNAADPIATANGVKCYLPKWPSHLVLYYYHKKHPEGALNLTDTFQLRNFVGDLYRGTSRVTDRFTFEPVNCTCPQGWSQNNIAELHQSKAIQVGKNAAQYAAATGNVSYLVSAQYQCENGNSNCHVITDVSTSYTGGCDLNNDTCKGFSASVIDNGAIWQSKFSNVWDYDYYHPTGHVTPIMNYNYNNGRFLAETDFEYNSTEYQYSNGFGLNPLTGCTCKFKFTDKNPEPGTETEGIVTLTSSNSDKQFGFHLWNEGVFDGENEWEDCMTSLGTNIYEMSDEEFNALTLFYDNEDSSDDEWKCVPVTKDDIPSIPLGRTCWKCTRYFTPLPKPSGIFFNRNIYISGTHDCSETAGTKQRCVDAPVLQASLKDSSGFLFATPVKITSANNSYGFSISVTSGSKTYAGQRAHCYAKKNEYSPDITGLFTCEWENPEGYIIYSCDENLGGFDYCTNKAERAKLESCTATLQSTITIEAQTGETYTINAGDISCYVPGDDNPQGGGTTPGGDYITPVSLQE